MRNMRILSLKRKVLLLRWTCVAEQNKQEIQHTPFVRAEFVANERCYTLSPAGTLAKFGERHSSSIPPAKDKCAHLANYNSLSAGP
jgi:hypothetical protein